MLAALKSVGNLPRCHVFSYYDLKASRVRTCVWSFGMMCFQNSFWSIGNTMRWKAYHEVNIRDKQKQCWTYKVGPYQFLRKVTTRVYNPSYQLTRPFVGIPLKRVSSSPSCRSRRMTLAPVVVKNARALPTPCRLQGEGFQVVAFHTEMKEPKLGGLREDRGCVFLETFFFNNRASTLGAYYSMRPGDCYVILVVWYPCPPRSRLKKRVVTTPGLGELPNPELWSTCVQSKLFCIKHLQWSTWTVMFLLFIYIHYSDSIYLVSLVASAAWNPFRFH